MEEVVGSIPTRSTIQSYVLAPKPAGKLRKLNPGGTDKPTQIASGVNFPVARLIELLEPAQWGEFTEEWATSVKSYKDVQRWSGPGDMGRDIVAFTTDKEYAGPWDNYQCKCGDIVAFRTGWR